MSKQIEEDIYSKWDKEYLLKALSDFIDEIPNLDKNKFMKMLVFVGDDVGIYNISDIKISESIGNGTAAETTGKKYVRIIYSGDEASKVMTIGTFSTYIKKILENLKDVDPKTVVVEVALQGKETKGQQFRFHYDESKNYAILVRGIGPNGAQKFIDEYQGDLVKVVTAPKIRAAKTTDAVNAKDSAGHKIKVWKKTSAASDDKKDDAKQDDKKQDDSKKEEPKTVAKKPATTKKPKAKPAKK